MQVVINRCYGGFGLSDEAIMHLQEAGDIDWSQYQYRTSPMLINTIEALGSERASADFAKLVVVEVEPGNLWRIKEYDGYESIEYFDIKKWNQS